MMSANIRFLWILAIYGICGLIFFYVTRRFVIMSRKDVKRRLELELDERKRIGTEVPPGTGAWRYSSGWIDALRWFLGEG